MMNIESDSSEEDEEIVVGEAGERDYEDVKAPNILLVDDEDEEEVDEPLPLPKDTDENVFSSSDGRVTGNEALPTGITSAECTDALNAIVVDCWDIGSWRIFLEEVEDGRGGTITVPEAYQRFLAQFPRSARYWIKLIGYFIRENERKSAEDSFKKCLNKCRNVELWTLYLKYIRENSAENSSQSSSMQDAYIAERRKYEAALEQAVENVGMLTNSTDIWRCYIDFISDTKVSGELEVESKTQALRRVYQRAVSTPMEGGEDIWTEYEQFETRFGEQSAETYLPDMNRKFLHAKSICHERLRFISTIVLDRIAAPPTHSLHELQQLDCWNRWIKFETINPDNLSKENFQSYMQMVFDLCLCCFRYHAEVWMSYAAVMKQISADILVTAADANLVPATTIPATADTVTFQSTVIKDIPTVEALSAVVAGTLTSEAAAATAGTITPSSTYSRHICRTAIQVLPNVAMLRFALAELEELDCCVDTARTVLRDAFACIPCGLTFSVYQRFVRRHYGITAARRVFSETLPMRSPTSAVLSTAAAAAASALVKSESAVKDAANSETAAADADGSEEEKDTDQPINIVSTSGQNDNSKMSTEEARAQSARRLGLEIFLAHSKLELEVNFSPSIAMNVLRVALNTYPDCIRDIVFVRAMSKALVALGDLKQLQWLFQSALLELEVSSAAASASAAASVSIGVGISGRSSRRSSTQAREAEQKSAYALAKRELEIMEEYVKAETILGQSSVERMNALRERRDKARNSYVDFDRARSGGGVVDREQQSTSEGSGVANDAIVSATGAALTYPLVNGGSKAVGVLFRSAFEFTERYGEYYGAGLPLTPLDDDLRQRSFGRYYLDLLSRGPGGGGSGSNNSRFGRDVGGRNIGKSGDSYGRGMRNGRSGRETIADSALAADLPGPLRGFLSKLPLHMDAVSAALPESDVDAFIRHFKTMVLPPRPVAEDRNRGRGKPDQRGGDAVDDIDGTQQFGGDAGDDADGSDADDNDAANIAGYGNMDASNTDNGGVEDVFRKRQRARR